MEDASEDMVQRYEEKKVELHEKIERELKEVQQIVRLVHVVPTAPSSSQTTYLEDKPTLQGEPAIWITLPQYSIKFPTPAALQASLNLDVEVNLKGVPPGQVEVLEAGLKEYRMEQREMTPERATQLRRLADATESRFHRAQEEKEKATEALQKEKEEVLERCSKRLMVRVHS
jgi:hypothetical protein